MLRILAILIGMSALVSACSLIDEADPSQTPIDRILPTTTPSAITAVIPTDNIADQPKLDVQIWSLGGNGWALRIGEKMLIFDYVRRGDPNPPAPGEARNLQKGYIDPEELNSFEVYVFVTHSHPDHFDQVIFEWQDQIDQIAYIFGWQADSNPDNHYLVNPRSQTQVDDVEVYTINSHSDVPEVAYLVKVDELTIYHNGDYRGSYLDDFEYLQTITDHIDIAFMIGWPYVSHQNFQQAEVLIEMFDPPYIFAICQEGNEDTSRQFAELLAEQGIESQVLYAEHRGAEFIISTKGID